MKKESLKKIAFAALMVIPFAAVVSSSLAWIIEYKRVDFDDADERQLRHILLEEMVLKKIHMF